MTSRGRGRRGVPELGHDVEVIGAPARSGALRGMTGNDRHAMTDRADNEAHRELRGEERREWGDAQLVVGVARGDNHSLAELYRRHGAAAYGLAKRVVADATEAEDVTQEVFLRLWQRPERFDARRGSLRTFLLTEAHSRAVDAVRARAARRRREEADGQAPRLTTHDLEREVADLALAERMAAALSELPASERTPIELAYFDGHTYRQVAEMLSEPEGTVKSRIRKGLQRMRGMLEEVEHRDVLGS